MWGTQVLQHDLRGGTLHLLSLCMCGAEVACLFELRLADMKFEESCERKKPPSLRSEGTKQDGLERLIIVGQVDYILLIIIMMVLVTEA